MIVFESPQSCRSNIRIRLDRFRKDLSEVEIVEWRFLNPYNIQANLPSKTTSHKIDLMSLNLTLTFHPFSLLLLHHDLGRGQDRGRRRRTRLPVDQAGVDAERVGTAFAPLPGPPGRHVSVLRHRARQQRRARPPVGQEPQGPATRAL